MYQFSVARTFSNRESRMLPHCCLILASSILVFQKDGCPCDCLLWLWAFAAAAQSYLHLFVANISADCRLQCPLWSFPSWISLPSNGWWTKNLWTEDHDWWGFNHFVWVVHPMTGMIQIWPAYFRFFLEGLATRWSCWIGGSMFRLSSSWLTGRLIFPRKGRGPSPFRRVKWETQHE